MTHEELINRLENDGCYEAIYNDSEGRRIVVIRSLDLYGFVVGLIRKAQEKDANLAEIEGMTPKDIARAIRDS